MKDIKFAVSIAASALTFSAALFTGHTWLGLAVCMFFIAIAYDVLKK